MVLIKTGAWMGVALVGALVVHAGGGDATTGPAVSAPAVRNIAAAPAPTGQEVLAALADFQSGEEQLLPSEGRLAGAQVLQVEQVADRAVVVSHATADDGGARTVFAELAFENGIGWYVQTAWDRPGGRPTFAQFRVGERTVVAWDGLGRGDDLTISGEPVERAGGRGIATFASEGTGEEVSIR